MALWEQSLLRTEYPLNCVDEDEGEADGWECVVDSDESDE